MEQILYIINTGATLIAVPLGFLAIWLSVHFYNQSRVSEKEAAITLQSIKEQASLLNAISLRQLDKLTDYVTRQPSVFQELGSLLSLLKVDRSMSVTDQFEASLREGKKKVAVGENEPKERQSLDGLDYNLLFMNLRYACLTNFTFRLILDIGSEEGPRKMDLKLQESIKQEINRSYDLVQKLRDFLEKYKEDFKSADSRLHSHYQNEVGSLFKGVGRADMSLRNRT